MTFRFFGLLTVVLVTLSGCFFSGGDKPPAVPVEPVDTENELPPPQN